MSEGTIAVRTVLGAVTDAEGKLALFLKPPSSIAADRESVRAPRGLAVQVVPCLAVAVGSGRVRPAADITLPELLPTLYRPPVRAKAGDGFLPLGDEGGRLGDMPATIAWEVRGEGRLLAGGASEDAHRLHGRILSEASFMTLAEADLILLALGPGVGIARGAPVTLAVAGAGSVSFRVD